MESASSSAARYESDGERVPIWNLTHPRKPPTFKPLTRNIEVDVTIVGAGIAGLTSAYLLSEEGKRVAIIEEREIGSGQTGRTSAHLTSAMDDHYFNLEKEHGTDGARAVARSHSEAIDLIQSICEKESIECDFRRVDGYLFLKPGDSKDFLEKECEAASNSGLEVSLLDRSPFEDLNIKGPVLKYANQAQFHPLQYISQLADVIARRGVEIYTHTRAQQVEGGNPASVVTDAGHVVQSKHIIVATCSPINQKLLLHAKMEPYRSYVVAMKVPKGSVPYALFWDTEDPYHYVRVVPTGEEDDILIIGGEDHKVGRNENHGRLIANLVAWTKERFPMAKDVVTSWSGQIMEPIDSLAFLGRSPGDKKNVYVITGDSGEGLTHTTIGASIINDLIMGRTNPWAHIYDPKRTRAKDLPEYVTHISDVQLQYARWVSPGDVQDIEDISPGCGAVIRSGLKKVAVYKDTEGQCHFHSAVCTHLGGIVRWNDFEKTWDCPVHGSRFDRYGNVVTGPAAKNLASHPPLSSHKPTSRPHQAQAHPVVSDKKKKNVPPDEQAPPSQSAL
jgi:glycine/D-amino acid oxidase-like deaminating enzyme/nitrite reductase/ring-hydroxylating ferredoxin subunit